jgi:hypothetical protein
MIESRRGCVPGEEATDIEVDSRERTADDLGMGMAVGGVDGLAPLVLIA